MSVWNYFQLIEVGTGFILLLLLIKLSKDLKRYYPLIFFLFLVIIEPLNKLLVDTNIILEYPSFIYLFEPLYMLPGLLIYFYARNHLQNERIVSYNDLIFFVPLILSFLIYIPYYLLPSSEKLIEFNQLGDFKPDVIDSIWEWVFEVTVNVYFLMKASKEITKYKLSLKNQLSDIQKIDLRTTGFLIKITVVIYISELTLVYLTFFGFPYYNVLYDLFNFIEFLLLFFIAYDGIVSHKYIIDLRRDWIRFSDISIKKDDDQIRYANSSLSEDLTFKIQEELTKYMSEHKPFLEPQLRIKSLSEKLNFSSHQISQVINEKFNQNFFEYINSYRIKEAIILLSDPKYVHYTYSAIGYEVGFNSKSAFFSAFKKYTGKTPAQYRNTELQD